MEIELLMTICVICKKEFVKSGNNQKCCGKECQKKLKNEYVKKYREENKDKIRNAQKRCEDNKPNKYCAIKRKWDDKNREFLNEKSRKINLTQERKDYKKKYAEKHKEKRNIRTRYRLKNDIMFRLNANMSSHIKYDLKNNKINKNRRHWEDIVGWTKNQLKSHIEKLFFDGMTWENYGEWEIDHIIPIVFFKYKNTNDVEFKYCWSLYNLQPLWANDNLTKRANVPGFKRFKGEYIKIA